MMLLIYHEEKCLACLYEKLNLQMKLSELRIKLKAEMEELLPELFQFLYEDIPLTSKQEITLTLAHCVIKSDDGSDDDLYKLYIRNSKTNGSDSDKEIQRTPSDDLKERQKSTIKLNINNDYRSSTSVSPLPTKNMPSIFTEEEISEQGCWLEQARQQHWNFKVQQLSDSIQGPTYRKSELVGIIDTDWTFRKAELLKLKASELKVNEERIRAVHAERLVNLDKSSADLLSPSPNIEKNLELVSKYTFMVQSEDNKLCELALRPGRRTEVQDRKKVQIEEQIHNFLSDLKRACDALYKALDAQELKLQAFKTSILVDCELEGPALCLTLEEENDVAKFLLIEN